MTDRIPLDHLTSDQLDELYARMERAESTVAGVVANATDWATRAPADDWGDTPHDTVMGDVGRFLLKLVELTTKHSRALQAEAAIARVHDLHCRNEHSGTCEHCSEHDYPDYSVPWPCPTIRALNGEAE
ncbi:hypothetical protein [Streptomyces cupreus]|uniref:Uncharacterized protein n=1 Tax=Streptomyces cupreus TaxID=2759956 RepID=A0A7X1M9Y8_9ACTN|nr:hypothetical protein [Streptomyces cupreus]MBC2903173.1 hypothetical protein [Streptomyces cupreus]